MWGPLPRVDGYSTPVMRCVVRSNGAQLAGVALAMSTDSNHFLLSMTQFNEAYSSWSAGHQGRALLSAEPQF